MCEEGVGMVGNELGFLWEEHQNQYMSAWANLSNNNSDNYSSGGGGTDQSTGHDESAALPKKTNMPPPTAAAAGASDGGQNGNNNNIISTKGKGGGGAGREGPASNRKRSRGGVCKNKNGKNDNNDDVGGDIVKVGGGESDHEIHIWTERERRKKMRNMFSNLHALLPQLPSKADKSTIVDEAVNYITTLQQTLQKLQKQKREKLQSGGGATTSTSTEVPSPLIMPNIPQQNALSNNYHDHYNKATREAFLADQGSCNNNNNNNNNNDLLLNNNNNNNNNNITNDHDPSNTAPLLSAVVSQAHYNEAPVAFQTWTSSNVVLNISGDDAHISVCSPTKPGLFSSICYVLEKHKIALVSAQLSSDGLRNMYMIHAHVSTNGASDQFIEAFNSVEELFKQAVGEIMFWVYS